MKFTLPGLTHRTAVIGKNGSGKTQFAVWLLSRMDLRIPWVVLDYKTEELINDIPFAKHIGFNSKIERTGLHVLHPTPHQNDHVESFLWRLWQKERVGVYIDEGYMVPEKGAFQALLTQGRSKRIPMIVLSQRPAWITRFVFSESNFFAVFRLQHDDDRKIVSKFVPADFGVTLPKYHAWWHDGNEDLTTVLKPVPERDTILDTFAERLAPRRKLV